MLELLRHADLGVTSVNVVENRPPAKDLEEAVANLPPDVREQIRKERWMRPELTHRGTQSSEVALPWSLESAGTSRYFSLAGPWLDILSKGYVVCIDELETSLHPLMARELLRLFFCPKENPKGAQILFTTHNPLLLDATLLRRDQVWFTDKDSEGSSHLYPLTDYSPRKGESLVRGYLAGRYGAVPFVPAGLLGTFPVGESLDPTKAEQESHE
jgi:predicted ATPase